MIGSHGEGVSLLLNELEELFPIQRKDAPNICLVWRELYSYSKVDSEIQVRKYYSTIYKIYTRLRQILSFVFF